MAGSELKLRKLAAGLYQIVGTVWAIGQTDNLREGPRGGSYGGWELRRYEDGSSWIVDSPLSFRSLADARDWVLRHPEEVSGSSFRHISEESVLNGHLQITVQADAGAEAVILIDSRGDRSGSMMLTPRGLAALLDGPLERALENAHGPEPKSEAQA